MTRTECEQKLFGLAQQAAAICRQYDPDAGRQISLTYIDGYITVYSIRRCEDNQIPEGKAADVYNIIATQFPDGVIWDTDEEYKLIDKSSESEAITA